MNVQQLLKNKGNSTTGISPGATIAEAAAKLKEANVGALVVTDDDGKLIGILSERDVVRAIPDGEGLNARKVEDLMTREVQTCSLSDRVEDLMRQMTEGRFRHLPVVDGNKLVGVVSIGDVVKNRLDELEREASELRAYISG